MSGEGSKDTLYRLEWFSMFSSWIQPLVETEAIPKGMLFREYAMRQSRLFFSRVFVVLCSFVVVAWPFDLFLFQGSQSFWDVSLWRIVFLGIAATGALLLRIPWYNKKFFFIHVVIQITAMSWCIGYFIAQMRITGVLPPLGLLLPVGSIFFLFSFKQRAFLTVILASMFSSSFFLFYPHPVPMERIWYFLSLSAVPVLLSLFVGHILYDLVHENFIQKQMLTERKEELEESDRLKQQFFANVTHELRTPLTLIMGSFSSLQREQSEEQKTSIQAGMRSASRLLSLIGQLLQLSAFEKGFGHPKGQKIDMHSICTKVTQIFQDALPSKASLNYNSTGETLGVFDPEQIKDLLFNLIGNAFKFSMDTQYTVVSVRLSGDSNEISIEVEDNGVGISEEEQLFIFDRFRQADGKSSRSFGGSGIGLSLVEAIVEAHGGSIAVRSSLGKGSTFTVRLPANYLELSSKSTHPSSWEYQDFNGADESIVREAMGTYEHHMTSGQKGDLTSDYVQRERVYDATQTILIVEDHDDLRSYLQRFLSRFFRTIVVSSGPEALETLKTQTPDLILSDLMMPGMDGRALMRTVRSNPLTKSIPFLVLTAQTRLDFRLEMLEEGVDDYILKPFQEDELYMRICNTLERYTQRTALERLNAQLEQANRQLIQRVDASTKELHAFARQVLHVKDQERESIAQDLHDELGQLLTGMRFELDLGKMCTNDPEAASVAFESTSCLLDEVLYTLRHMLTDLKPKIVQQSGLAEAIRWLVAGVEKRTPLRCSLALEPKKFTLSESQSIAVFRIAQESLTNILKHAQAKEVLISMKETQQQFEMIVQDDGLGFEPGHSKTSLGLGVLGMKERALSIGADLHFASRHQQGTMVHVHLPLNPSSAPSSLVVKDTL